MLNLATMQKCKVYFRRDLKTTNPRKLFRFITNTLTEMGYMISYNSVNIQKDPIGDTGVVDGSIIATKEHKLKLQREQPNMAFLVIVAFGCILLLAGLNTGNVFAFFLGLVLISIGGYSFMKFKINERKIISCDIDIYVKGIGEAYRGKHIEDSDEKALERDQVITEMSLNLAGDESAIEKLGSDMRLLLERVDTFTE